MEELGLPLDDTQPPLVSSLYQSILRGGIIPNKAPSKTLTQEDSFVILRAQKNKYPRNKDHLRERRFGRWQRLARFPRELV